MKKILYLVTQAEMGGAQKYVLELASEFQNKGCKTLVASEKNELFKEKLFKNGINFIVLKNIQRNINLFSDIKSFFEIYNLLKKEKPDILHANSSKMGIFGAFAGKLAKTPKIIFTAHGWVFNEDLPLLKKYFYIFLSRLSALFEDEIICVSNFDKKTALKYKVGSEKKLHIINNGIDPKKTIFFSKEETLKKLKLPKDKKIIGTIGNLYKNKGTKYFIEAAKNLLEERKDLFFIIIGDGLEKENLKMQIEKLKIKNNIKIIKIETEAYKYLKAFDIFVLPSQKEGFPYTLLEAGLAEIPIVATSVGGIPDLINDENGVLILPKSPIQIKNAILSLLQSKKKQILLTKNLHQEILQNFTFKKMIKETENIYFNQNKKTQQ